MEIVFNTQGCTKFHPVVLQIGPSDLESSCSKGNALGL